MSRLEDLLRETLVQRAEEAPSAVAELRPVRGWGRPRRNTRRWLAAAAAAAAVAMVSVISVGLARNSSSNGVRQLSGVQSAPSAAVFGYPSVGVLTAAAPRPGDKAIIPQATALQEIEHPLSSPRVAGPPRIVGLARVTAVGGYVSGDAPSVHDMLAWVGAYELDRNAEPKCPAEPLGSPSAPASLPPLMAHYYFVVLVDASTGHVATWEEDESGLTMRQCAGLPVT